MYQVANKLKHCNKMSRASKLSQEDIEQIITRKLAESGERERLRERLLKRLDDTGWREDVKEKVKKYADRHGIENVQLEDIVQELAPKASSLVSEDIKHDLKKQIQVFLDEQAEY